MRKDWVCCCYWPYSVCVTFRLGDVMRLLPPFRASCQLLLPRHLLLAYWLGANNVGVLNGLALDQWSRTYNVNDQRRHWYSPIVKSIRKV